MKNDTNAQRKKIQINMQTSLLYKQLYIMYKFNIQCLNRLSEKKNCLQ